MPGILESIKVIEVASTAAAPSATVILASVCFGLFSLSNVVQADDLTDIEKLERQITEERQRLDALEEELKRLKSNARSAAKTISESTVETKNEAEAEVVRSGKQLLAAEGRDDPYLDEQFTKSIPLFGSPWRFSFGGYAKTDLIHDFTGTGNKQQFLLSQIPVDGSLPEGSYSYLQVSETRFHFDMRNTESTHENKMYLEFDFFDESNPSSLRLRHAYVNYGKLVAGQTWTLLSELRQLPLILDFAAGDSILGGRTVQLRWTSPSSDRTFGWAVALEKFDDSGIYNPTNLPGVSRSDYPRLASGFTKLWDRLLWSTGAAVTQLRFDGTDGVGNSSDLAYTVTTAGRLYLDQNKGNWLGFGIGYESGSITDVITYANAGLPNAAIDSNGNFDLAKAWNTQLGLHLIWTKALSSNFSYAYAKIIDVPDVYEPDWIRVGSSLHANLIYKYDDQLSLGVEVMHGLRENVNGLDGDAQRIQFSTFYYF